MKLSEALLENSESQISTIRRDETNSLLAYATVINGYVFIVTRNGTIFQDRDSPRTRETIDSMFDEKFPERFFLPPAFSDVAESETKNETHRLMQNLMNIYSRISWFTIQNNTPVSYHIGGKEINASPSPVPDSVVINGYVVHEELIIKHLAEILTQEEMI